MSTDDRRAEVERHLKNFAAIIGRMERFELNGRNADSTHAAGRSNYGRAFRAIVEMEDAQGVEPAAKQGERLRTLMWRAIDAGLISEMDVCEVEQDALRRIKAGLR